MLNPAVMFGGILGTVKAKDIIIIILKQQGTFKTVYYLVLGRRAFESLLHEINLSLY